MEIWGPAATETQLKRMQSLQNSVLRFICNERRGARTKDLLTMTGILSIRQLIALRVLMSGLSALWRGQPKTMSGWEGRKERRLVTTKRSFRYMFGELANRLPANLKEGDPQKMKKEIKAWVRDNIPVEKKWNKDDDIESDSENEE